MPLDDDFLDIVRQNNLEEHMENAEPLNITIQQLVLGLKFMGATMAIITDFINDFYGAIDDEESSSYPVLSQRATVLLREMFDYCERFTDEIMEDILGEEDD